MLALRVSATADRADELAETLGRTHGVRRLTRAPAEAPPGEVVLSADLTPSAADRVIGLLSAAGVDEKDYAVFRQELVAPSPVGRQRHGEGEDFAWVELMGEARANARPIGRYLALMTVAAVVAAMGVLEDNQILIVGAMAVSPDLLPICATCVGIVRGRHRLARRAFTTLTVGLALVGAVAAAVTALLDLTGILSAGFSVANSGLGSLADADYSTVLVALAAGVAGLLAFETRASAAVGVAISVTTIPASAYLGVAIGVGQGHEASGALAVLAINVGLLILSGTLTLFAQHRWARRGGR